MSSRTSVSWIKTQTTNRKRLTQAGVVDVIGAGFEAAGSRDFERPSRDAHLAIREGLPRCLKSFVIRACKIRDTGTVWSEG